MESYKNKTNEELLDICKAKLTNGRTYDELVAFFNHHDIDKETRQYIFAELEKYEVYLKQNPSQKPTKPPIPATPLNIVFGIALIALAFTVLLIGNMSETHYLIAIPISITGIIFIGVEVSKIIINFFREKA